MKALYPAILASLAFAAPAWGAEATLEGYGGDGALLVGIDSGDSPFGDTESAQSGGGSRVGGGGGDGNLVAESGPVAAGATQGTTTTTSPEQPSSNPNETPSSREPNGNRRRTHKTGPSGREQPQRQPTPVETRNPSQAGGAEAQSGSGTPGLPFTGTELALLLAGFLGLAALGTGMHKLAHIHSRI